jgi:hypothetical protein
MITFMRLTCLAIATGMMAPGLAHAQTVATPPNPDVVVEGRIPDRDKRVCKQTTPTGSIIPSRTCRTKAEWEQIRERGIALLERLKADREREKYIQWLLQQ